MVLLTTVCPKGSSGSGLKYPVILRVVVVPVGGYALQGICECGPVASLWSFSSGALLELLSFRVLG